MSAVMNTNQLSPAGRRRQRKAARRGVFVQCDRCGCNGTGQLGATGRLSSVDHPAVYEPGRICHAGCGGRFSAFDIGAAS